MSHRSYSSPYSPSAENFEFVRKLTRKLSRNQYILFESCQKFLGQANLTYVTDNFISLFRDKFLKSGDSVNSKTMNLFLNIFRVINPPGKRHRQVVETYVENLVTSCQNPNIREVLEGPINPETSLLIKLLNERIYEETVLNYPDETGSLNISERKFHLVPVTHQNETKRRNLFRLQIMSSIFEEICFLTIQQQYNCVSTIHLPKAGDILLANKQTLEIKANQSKTSSISKSQSKYGIHSGPAPIKQGNPPEGFVMGITILEKTRPKSTQRSVNYRRQEDYIYFNNYHIQNFNEDISQAIRLANIEIPPSVSISLMDLLLGDMNNGPSIPILVDSLLLPTIVPDFMENNNLGSTRAFGMKKIKSSKNKYYPGSKTYYPTSGKHKSGSSTKTSRTKKSSSKKSKKK